MTDPTDEPSSYNTPVDDPHHYDFKNADVPISPDERTPSTHAQHEGGYETSEGLDSIDLAARLALKKDD